MPSKLFPSFVIVSKTYYYYLNSYLTCLCSTKDVHRMCMCVLSFFSLSPSSEHKGTQFRRYLDPHRDRDPLGNGARAEQSLGTKWLPPPRR